MTFELGIALAAVALAFLAGVAYGRMTAPESKETYLERRR